jgi:hypothetical protein
MRASRKCWATPVASMKPSPPWIWTAVDVAAQPVSVHQAFTTGVSRSTIV